MDKLSSQQAAAQRYIDEQDIERIISEMLNSLVHEKSKTPILYMIKYLAGLLSEEEKKVNGLVIPEPYPKGKPIVRYPVFVEKSNSLLKKHLTKMTWATIKYNKTLYGGTINHLIRLNESNPSHVIGLTMTDSDALFQFGMLIEPLLREYHNLKLGKTTGITEVIYKPIEYINFDLSQFNLKMFFPYQQLASNFIKSLFFDISRNLEDFPFPILLTKEKRQSIEENIKATLLILSDEEDSLLKGNIYSLQVEDEDKVNEIFSLFSLSYEETISHLINIGAYENWPNNRSIYVTNDRKVLILINFEDHFRMICNINPVDDNVLTEFMTYFGLLKKIEKSVTFTMNPVWGYVNTCPSNIGIGIKYTCELGLSHLNKLSQSQVGSVTKALKFDYYKSNQINQTLNMTKIIYKSRLSSLSEYHSFSNFYNKLLSLIVFDQDKSVLDNLSFKVKYFEEESGETFLTYQDVYEDFLDEVSPFGNNINSLIPTDNLIEQEKIHGGYILKDLSEVEFYYDLVKNYIIRCQGIKFTSTCIHEERILSRSNMEKNIERIANINVLVNFCYFRNLFEFEFCNSKGFQSSGCKDKVMKLIKSNKNIENIREVDEKKYKEKEEMEENLKIILENTKFQAEILNKNYKNSMFSVENRCFVVFDIVDSNIKNVIAIINDVNHLTIQGIYSYIWDENDYLRLLSLLNQFDSERKFYFSEEFGFLGPSIKQFGNGFTLSTRLNQENLNKTIDEMRNDTNKFHFLSETEIDNYTYVSSKEKVGVLEWEVMKDFNEFVNKSIRKLGD